MTATVCCTESEITGLVHEFYRRVRLDPRLGPIFNARSCQGCHLKDGRGHPPNGNWPDDDAVSMFLRLSIPPETDEQRQALADRRDANGGRALCFSLLLAYSGAAANVSKNRTGLFSFYGRPGALF